MTTSSTISFPGQYIQGPGLLQKLPEMMSAYGTVPMALVTPSFQARVREILGKNEQAITESFGGECTHGEIQRVYQMAKNNQVSVLAGVGGGKALDCAKAVADRLNIPVIIVPTIASTDAPCTAISVIYSDAGAVVDFVQQNAHPAVVLVDTEIILSAPVRYLVAGMGDALATGYEAVSCEKKGAKAFNGGNLTETGLALARLATELVFTYGRQAREDCIAGRNTPAVEKIIEANILLSGIGFEACNLAAAHSIHNGLTRLPQTKSYQHGEKVAFGILVGLHLNQASVEELDKVYSFYQEVGLPVTLGQIGLEQPSPSELELIAHVVCSPDSMIYNEPVEITTQAVLAALQAADAMGRSFTAILHK